MGGSRFDALAKTLATGSGTRRYAVAAGIGGAMLSALRVNGAAKKRRGKRKRKTRKPRLRRNEFGCVDVGGACRGNTANCCSGICEGVTPKKGKKDNSICVAHDTAGICFADSDSCTLGQINRCNLDPGFESCLCLLTTGSAGFCGDGTGLDPTNGDEFCRACIRDTDCQDEFGPRAACVILSGLCSATCPDTDRRACARPCPASAS